jgi:hypothetical protein
MALACFLSLLSCHYRMNLFYELVIFTNIMCAVTWLTVREFVQNTKDLKSHRTELKYHTTDQGFVNFPIKGLLPNSKINFFITLRIQAQVEISSANLLNGMKCVYL